MLLHGRTVPPVPHVHFAEYPSAFMQIPFTKSRLSMRFHDFPGGLDELSNDEKMYVDILLGDEIYINIDKKYDDLVELIRGFNRFLSLNSPSSSSIECSDDCGGLFGRLFNFLNGLTLEEFCELYVTWDKKKQNCALAVIQYKLMNLARCIQLELDNSPRDSMTMTETQTRYFLVLSIESFFKRQTKLPADWGRRSFEPSTIPFLFSNSPRYGPIEIGKDQSASFVLRILSSLRHVGTPIVVETVVHKCQHPSAFNWYGTFSDGRCRCFRSAST